jgi:hypothetical protein
VKVEITVNIKKEDGTLALSSTTMEVDVPDFEEFTGPDDSSFEKGRITFHYFSEGGREQESIRREDAVLKVAQRR